MAKIDTVSMQLSWSLKPYKAHLKIISKQQALSLRVSDNRLERPILFKFEQRRIDFIEYLLAVFYSMANREIKRIIGQIRRNNVQTV